MTKTINTEVMTTLEVAARFNRLAQVEKWFEIQDELFADNVKSIEPENSPYLKNEYGKIPVKKKGEMWVARITGINKLFTTEPIVTDNHFAVGREIDITVNGHGRVQINEIMLYEVRNGKIISELFFY